MNIPFYKYQGTGNDFIIIDNSQTVYSLTQAQVQHLCNRRFGIGGDGLILFSPHEGYDFKMTYYNADGAPSTMCGNGGRCLVQFAYHAGMHKNSFHFLAADGPHDAEISSNGTVRLKMQDVTNIETYHGDAILNTGSPHYVQQVPDVMAMNVYNEGQHIRYHHHFAKEGINVNFVQQKNNDEIIVRTYERGVEDETYSCGTGVVAAAIVCYHNEMGFNEVKVNTKGGKLLVEYDKESSDIFKNIWLCGPAQKVFAGTIDV
jgi:diaminopimelate epimerase